MCIRDRGDTITLEHGDLNADGEISTISGANETLSTTVPTILIRKGNYWYGYGGGAVTTPTDIDIVANNSANETVYPTFVDGQSGAQEIETDVGLTYNPSTGLLTAVGLTLSGDLTVNGTTTTINSTTLTVDDKNIEMGSVSTPSDTTADGGGIDKSR